MSHQNHQLKRSAMIMTPSFRKLALTIHLTFSVGWIGAVVAYLALGVSAVAGQDAQTVRAAWIAMELTGWYVIVPLALAALLTGIVMSLGTPWGLFRHYWVLFSLVLTILATVVLLLHMPRVSTLTNVAREADSADLGRLGGDLFHPGVGLLILLVITALNVYKPRGLTPYGWRKRREQGDTAVGPDFSLTMSTPRWVKVFGIVVIVLILLVAIMMLGGGRGPAAHMSPNG